MKHEPLRSSRTHLVLVLAGCAIVLTQFAVTLLGQQTRLRPAEALARALESEFNAVAWDSTYQEWRNSHPKAACQEFRGNGGYILPSEDWCDRCERQNEAQRAGWYFYVFDLATPLACRLEQFHAQANVFTEDNAREAYRQLELKLTARFGPAESARAVPPEFRATVWGDVRRWQTQDLTIYLFLSERSGRPVQLELLVLHRHLTQALAESQQLAGREWVALARAEASLDPRLVEELGAAYPGLAALAQDPASQSNQAAQARIGALLTQVLNAAKTAPRERRPALLLAADRLADRLWHGGEVSAAWDHERQELASFGVHYHFIHIGGDWEYQHDLLWRVWKEYGATDWGERAFVLLLNHGWDTSGECRQGSDQFREVIRRGKDFLVQRPKGPHRLEVLLSLAQAYETWWSLSQAAPCKSGHATDCDPYVTPELYQTGAAAARQKAIRYYEQLLRLASNSPEAAYARLHLPRLKLEIDTNQRAFSCIYD